MTDTENQPDLKKNNPNQTQPNPFAIDDYEGNHLSDKVHHAQDESLIVASPGQNAHRYPG